MEIRKIPNTLGFSINEIGDIFDEQGNKRVTYKNGDGYITSSVKTIDNKWVTFGVQRLVAISFLEKPENQDANEVNHRDGDITNNFYKNLEWVTSYENNIHSEIMRTDNVLNTIKLISKDGLIRLLRNAKEASALTGIDKMDIWDCIKNKTSINGNYFYFQSGKTKIPDELKIVIDKIPPAKKIKLKNIETFEIFNFDSFASAARYFNTSASHIYKSIPRQDSYRLFRKVYEVAYLEDEFKVVDEETLERAKEQGSKTVLAYNTKNKMFGIYESAMNFIREHNLSKKSVTTSLRQNNFRIIDSWIVTYFSKENYDKLKTFVLVPADAKVI